MTNPEQSLHFAAEYISDGVIIAQYYAHPKNHIVVP